MGSDTAGARSGKEKKEKRKKEKKQRERENRRKKSGRKEKVNLQSAVAFHLILLNCIPFHFIVLRYFLIAVALQIKRKRIHIHSHSLDLITLISLHRYHIIGLHYIHSRYLRSIAYSIEDNSISTKKFQLFSSKSSR